MRKSLFFLLIIATLSSNAQNFWSTVNDSDLDNKSNVTDCTLFKDSLIIVGGLMSNASCHFHNIIAYDLTGNLLWKKNSTVDLVYTDSNSIYSAGFTLVDDVAGFEQIIISKFDKQGNEVFRKGYPDLDKPRKIYFYFKPTSMLLSHKGEIVVSSTNSIVKVNTKTSTFSEYKLKLSADIKNIQIIDSRTYLINTETKYYKSDSSFNLLDSIAHGNSFIKALIVNDTIYSLFEHKIVLLDVDFKTINTFSSSSNSLVDIKKFGSNMWIQAINSKQISLYKIKGSEFIDTLNFDLLFTNKSFLVSKKTLAFIGNTYSDQIGLYVYKNFENSIQFSLPNIEIVDFDIDSITFDYFKFLDTLRPRGYRFNTNLTIKNTGNDTLRTFALFSDLSGGFNCAQNFYYQKFSNVSVLPNQTVTVKLNRIYEDGFNNKICFECLSPNSKIETDTSRNKLCKSFTITGLEESYNEDSYKIYPNPLDKSLNIEFNEDKTRFVELFSLDGISLFKENITQKRNAIDLSKYPSGLYFLRIYSDNKLLTKKIILQ